MYVIREVMHCKPGKVGDLLARFTGLSGAVEKAGHERIRLLTDVSGDNFWTMVAEIRVEQIDDFFAMEQQLMANDAVRGIMAGYHDLVDAGRREIYREVGTGGK